MVVQVRRVGRLVDSWHSRRDLRARLARSRWIVLYAPSRTPKGAGEDGRTFVRRVGRTNRPEGLAELFDISEDSEIVTLQVRAGLDPGDGPSDPGVVEFLFAVFGTREIAEFSFAFVRGLWDRQRPAFAILVAALSAMESRFRRHPNDFLLITSNSTLVELLRLAVIRVEACKCVEVLHGIASVGMEAYYDFIESQARARLVYVNLIAGLVHFQSIQRHLLVDETGEVAANCQLWSTIPRGKSICLPSRLVRERPLVIVGGTAADPSYFASPFFDAEVRLMAILRAMRPEAAICYCPHPANDREDPRMLAAVNAHGVEVAREPTILVLLGARAVCGRFSTSLFEAALLGKAVFLLPFDHGMLLPELLALAHVSCREDDLEREVGEFLKITCHQDDLLPVQRVSMRVLGLEVRLEEGALSVRDPAVRK